MLLPNAAERGMEAVMRERWISVAPGAALAVAIILTATGPASAQQAAPVASQEQSDQPAPPPKTKQTKKMSPASQTNPDLDPGDQLAPSQMNQPVPAAVAQPGGAPSKPAHPVATAEPAAGPHGAASAAASTHVVTCGGLFAKDSSHLKLAMTFETKNIAFADVDADGGAKVPATVLFPKDPKRRLEVWWSNPAARSGVYLVVINGKSTWSAPGGMKLGLTLAQLEKLNGKPFKLKGFDKNGVATISDWDGGKLAALIGGCKSGVSLTADPKAAADAVAALTADKEYSSADPEMRAVTPAVSEILIGY
jgi:hypothetical protein